VGLREVLDAGVAGCTCGDTPPEVPMIQHNTGGTQQLVRSNLDGPDTIIRAL